MLAFIDLHLLSPEYWVASPMVALFSIFQIWMLIDAIRRKEWIWAIFIFIGWGLSALLYFFFVYRNAPSATRGFELPGAHDRRRIKELQAQIHHLDKAHHYLQLADIYFQQGKLDKAEVEYRASLERDPQDIDARAHYGQCLLRLKRPAEARPFLESAVAENAKHDYGHTLMALAETMSALSQPEAALQLWKQVTEKHSYPRAKVQLAELYLAKGQPELARPELQDVVSDDAYAPTFQRRRDRVWVSRARRLLKQADSSTPRQAS